MSITDVAYRAYTEHLNGCGIEVPAFCDLSLDKQEAWCAAAQAAACETIDEIRRQQSEHDDSINPAHLRGPLD